MKKKSKKQLQKEIDELVRQLLTNFEKEYGRPMTKEEFDQRIEKMLTVSTLPAGLYQHERNSGKTLEEVYQEITNKEN